MAQAMMALLANYLPVVSRATSRRRIEAEIASLVNEAAKQLEAKRVGRRRWRIGQREVGTTRLVEIAMQAAASNAPTTKG